MMGTTLTCFLAVLAKLSMEIISNNYSCGGLLMLSGGGKGV